MSHLPVITVLAVTLTAARAFAQDGIPGLPQMEDSAVRSAIQDAHTLHVAPHLLVLTPDMHSTVVTFSNHGSAPIDAMILLQDGYPVTSFASDTALFPRQFTWGDLFPHDTVVAVPRPQDHYAGGWITGLPSHLKLNPHETRRVTLRFAPPPDLPSGEYYARILTVVAQTGRHGQSRDTKAVYAIPLQGGKGPSPLRDSVRIFFRKGPQSMGLQILHAEAHIDTAKVCVGHGFRNPPVGLLIRYHLTGTARVGATVYISWQNGAMLTNPQGNSGMLYADGTMRFCASTDPLLESGPHVLVVTFRPWQSEFPLNQRIPMAPVQVSIPVDIPPR